MKQFLIKFLVLITALRIFCDSGSLLKASEIDLIEYRCDQMLDLLKSAANQDYIGESISQLEHALQCAHQASLEGSTEETILAALFHDIGHLCLKENTDMMAGYGVANHDIVGANFLHDCGMSENVCQLVLGHVQAKRYLTRDPEYYIKLSDASKMTLTMQGGPMSELESREFETDPLFDGKILMRVWDEKAKIVGLDVPGIDNYRAMLLRHLHQE